MDLGRGHRAGSGGRELVQPSFLAAGARGPKNANPYRWFGLGFMVGQRRTLVNRAYAPLFGVVGRLRLWRAPTWSDSFDTIFRVLKLEAPVSVEASSRSVEETYPLASIIRYNLPAPVRCHPVKFTWYGVV